MKKKHMDFILHDDEYDKIKFRFYPRESHVHGFTEDTCPKTWNAVYKHYYSWAILQAFKDDEIKGEEPALLVFDMSWDECSALLELSTCLQHVIDKKKRHLKVSTFGQPGSDWELKYRKAYAHNPNYDWKKENPENVKQIRIPKNDYVEFHVWNNWTNCGYRFTLDIPKCKDFVVFLNEVNAHMLENSEPI